MRIFWLSLLSALTIASAAHAADLDCTAKNAWERVRAAYPLHVQTLALCENKGSGEVVVVLTEPPAHITRLEAEKIMRALLRAPIVAVDRSSHKIGFDGWAEDLVIVLKPKTGADEDALIEDLAALAALVFGSAYKAELEDIARLEPAPHWQAPPSLGITLAEVEAWLLGTSASPPQHQLVDIDSGHHASLMDRAERQETGVFYSDTRGLVVALLPTAAAGKLNSHVRDLRRFAVDTDALLGAVQVTSKRVALIGRERTTSFAAMPPLRVEMMLLLASVKKPELAQSYERHSPFAGKLGPDAGELENWDWAPILLSDELVDTEYGSLLNIADIMVKAWSEGGAVVDKGFAHPAPARFPFGDTGLFRLLRQEFGPGFTSLTYNWNTSGAGVLAHVSGRPGYVLSDSASLPVSYFASGAQLPSDQLQAMRRAEEEAIRWFTSLQTPTLARVAQYAAFFQLSLALDLQAVDGAKVPQSATFPSTLKVLERHANTALMDADKSDFSPECSKWVPRIMGATTEKCRLIIQNRMVEAKRMRLLNTDDDASELLTPVLPWARSPEVVRQDVVDHSVRIPNGWIRTPSIAVSQHMRDPRGIGGHNVYGRATRIEADRTVPLDQPVITGNFDNGRTIRVHPSQREAVADLMRKLDGEIGRSTDPETNDKVARQLASWLKEAPLAKPIRPLADALKQPSASASGERGAGRSNQAFPIRLGHAPMERNKAEAVISASHKRLESGDADVVVASIDNGFVVSRGKPPTGPASVHAPNTPSLLEVLDVAVTRTGSGPPPVPHPKIQFIGVEPANVIRQVEALQMRGEAVGNGGGKPPFDGGRAAFAPAEPPERGRPLAFMSQPEATPRSSQPGIFARAVMEVYGLFGLARSKLHVEGRNTEAALRQRPDWKAVAATLKFPDPGGLHVVGAPKREGFIHITEFSVPMVKVGGDKQSALISAVTWFRERITGTKAEEINARVKKRFEGLLDSDVEAALTRYKDLMTGGRPDEYDNREVWIKIRLEGNDIIIVDILHAIAQRGEG